jgi:hypothetical protein
MTARVEVRVVTYKRPEWLRHALVSLIEQDHQDWHALVFDDSAGREGADVVALLADARIEYRPNVRNLGASGNLNLALTPHAMAGGVYACILEDDNWFLPGFLRENIRTIQQAGTSILLRNQAVFRRTADATENRHATTRGRWFSEGVYSPVELRARILLCEGIANGGLFWRTDMKSELRVDDRVTNSGLQEVCRTLLIAEPIAFAQEPLGAFALMEEQLKTRVGASNRVFGRGLQSLHRYAIRRHGAQLIQLAKEVARRAAGDTSRDGTADENRRRASSRWENLGARGLAWEQVATERLDYFLLDALKPGHVQGAFTNVRKLKTFAKCLARSVCVPDPVADFLRDFQDPVAR